MDYTTKLQYINNKYYNKLKNTYGCYINNFDAIPNMMQQVYIIADNKCKGKFKDISKNRGKCISKNGKIYIRESALSEQLLVHEFIHRLSRNYKRIGLLKWCWIEGIMYFDKKICYFGINEVLTEWLAYNITNIKENNAYTSQFAFIDKLKQHPDAFNDIIEAYFSSDKDKLEASLWSIFYANTFNIINTINNNILNLTTF